MFPEEFNERCSRSLQHDTLVQIRELPHGPNLSPARTESGPNFGMLIFIWPYATFCSHIPSTPILKLQPCSSSICKHSFIPSAVPALVRGPLSQWWLGFFIFCWRQTYLMQTVISAREGEFCLCLALLHSGFQNREFKLLSRTGSFYFLRERLPCWPFRDQRLKSPISSYPTGRKTSYQFFKICFP